MRATMKIRRTIGIVALSALIVADPLTALASNPANTSKPLDEKENPLLIGKRDINKRQINFYSLEKELALGAKLAAEIEKELKLVDDPVVTEYINRIGQNIVLHSDAKVPFTIKVVSSDEINAFALPGGHFYINTGLILTADTESEIAGVMAHEIAHVTARHAVENFSKSQLLQYASIPLIFVGGGLGQLAQLGANLGLALSFFKFSRGAEKEADMLGAQYMWASGYDPNSLITFFEKLEAKKKKQPNAFSKLFLTHPTTPDRIKAVRALLGRFPERDEYVINSSEFSQVKQRLSRIVGSAKRLNAAEEQKRPTLKRLPSDSTPRSGQDSEEPDAPVLKRPEEPDAHLLKRKEQ